MKKVTAFFMALLPVFVTVLLFIAGYIIKSSTHIFVKSIEMVDSSIAVLREDDTKDEQVKLEVNVYPKTATNKELQWISSNPDILEVDNQGNVKCKDYGIADIYATSVENPTCITKCEVEVYDTKIHNVLVSDAEKYNLSYVGMNQSKKIQTTVKPNTRIENPTLKYEPSDTQSKEVLDVAPDGLILPKKIGDAKVKIYPEANPTKVTEVDIKITQGVDIIDANEQKHEITTSHLYDLYSDLHTAPENKSNLNRNDFVYQSLNEDIAEVSQDGVALFKQPGEAKFDIKFKRDESKVTSKTVYSSCNYIQDIHFDSDVYTQNIEYKDGQFVATPITNLHCDPFPKSTSYIDMMSIESSNNEIVSVTKEDGEFKFTALRPGTCYLTAVVKTDDKDEFMIDSCLVNVTCKDNEGKVLGLIKQPSITLPAGMYYYNLKDNLNLAQDGFYPGKITFEVNQLMSDAYITSENNSILHFSGASSGVPINVYVDDELAGSFTVTSQAGVTPIEITNDKDTYVINAGQRYKFTNGSPEWHETLLIRKWYAQHFDYVESGNYDFSAKYGNKIDDFVINLNDGTTKTIHLIVKEDPISLQSEKPLFFSTTENSINFKDEANVSIVPSTATKEDGSKYDLTYSYELEKPDIATIEGDTITFKKPGIVKATVGFDDTHKITTQFKSTFGSLPRFNVYSSDKTTRVYSNSDIKMLPNKTQQLYITGISEDEASQIKMESITSSAICDFSIGQYADNVLPITINSKADIYGQQTLRIYTLTHSVYINIVVDPTIIGFGLTHNRTQLKPGLDNKINSYTKNLEFNIQPYPILVDNPQYTTSYIYNGGTETLLDHTNNKISLNNLDNGEYQILFKWKVGDEDKTLSYYFTVTDDYSQFKVDILNSEDGNLYLQSNEIQKTLYLKANGLVDKDFFSTSGFSLVFDRDTPIEKSEIIQDTLTIYNIPSPKDELDYSHQITLKYNTYEIGKYNLSRDLVSKIKFPKHDNSDMTDKKGLQKVHVFGNRTPNDDSTAVLDYYKLPIDMYNYKSELITDETLRLKAFNQLNVSLSDPKSSYEYKDGYINIKFNNETLYSEKEIYDNAFDAKQNKNVTITAETKTHVSNIKYTFVPVNGVNVYNQKDIKLEKESSSVFKNIVLQNDFGTVNGAKFDDKSMVKVETSQFQTFGLTGILGNGHIIDFHELFNKFEVNEPRQIAFLNAMNTKIVGFSDAEFKWGISNRFDIAPIDYYNSESGNNSYNCYNEYSNLNDAIIIKLIKNEGYFKNCVFHTVLSSCFNTGGFPSKKAFIENCSFFNCGTFAFWYGLNNPEDQADIFFKGKISVYNFKGREIFQHFWGTDVSAFVWPAVSKIAYNKNMAQINGAGNIVINSFMITWLNEGIYFWNGTEYVQSSKGFPATAEYLQKYVDIKIPFVKNIEFSLWGSPNPDVMPAAPNYYDQYTSDDQLKPEFLRTLINDLCRHPTYF